MPVDRLANDDSGQPASRASWLWALPLVFLVGVWLWLVFSSGGYPAKRWVFPALALGLFGFTAAYLLIYPRRPHRLSLTVLALFAAYSVWAAASSLWAGSASTAWLGSTRAFTYVLVLALAMAYFTFPWARRVFRYLILLAGFALLIVLIWRIWSASHLAALFSANRLTYPFDRADSAAALFLVLFWPLMWLAAAPDERAPVRGVALGLATGLLGLAILTQSRGAAWSLAITLVLFFFLSAGRVRLLFYLVVPGLLMTYAFPHLNRYWTLGPDAVGGSAAARALTVAVIAAAFIGMILALLEDWVRVTGRMRVIFGAIVLAACLASIIYGAFTFTEKDNGPIAWFQQAWSQLMTEPAPSGAVTSPATLTLDGVSSHTRAEAWRLAWQDFENAPLLGAGVDNSGRDFYASGLPSGADGSEPAQLSESLVLQVLGDTGIIGAILAFGAILLCIVGILWPRLAVGWVRTRGAWKAGPGKSPRIAGTAGPSAGWTVPAGALSSRWGDQPMTYGWETAMFAGAAYWFVHANMERLWPVPGVTVPALLMLAAGLASTDARAGTLWPWIDRWWRQVMPKRSPDGPLDGGEQRSDGTGPTHAARQRPATWRRALATRLRPADAASQVFRIGLMVLSAGVVILTVLAYLLVLR